MKFYEALQLLEDQEAIYREGWNGTGMFIKIQFPNENSKMTQPYVYISTTDGELIPWLCSQQDILATDWKLK